MSDEAEINPRTTFYLRMETTTDGGLDFEDGAIDGHDTIEAAVEKAKADGAENKVDVSFIYECRPVRSVSRKFVVSHINGRRGKQ